MNSHVTENSAEHQEMSLLIPWYVNDTIDDRQRKRFEAHLSQCAACRGDLQLERRVAESVNADLGVEYMPAPSLRRLQARLDALDAAGDSAEAAPVAAGEPAIASVPARRSARWKMLMAASVVMIALALGLVLVDRQLRTPAADRNYYTVTSPAPRVPDAVIRAVFAPTITLVELQAVLDESQLRIVAGPTEAGVYSLATNSALPVSTSLAMLRKHSTVRFAESTSPAPEPK